MHSVGSCNYGDEFRVSVQVQKFLNSLETVFQEVGFKAHGKWMDRFQPIL
jgi:allantoicase